MMIKKSALLTFLFSFLLLQLNAQHTDAALWTGAGVSFDIGKDFKCEIAEELRYNISVADLYQKNTNIGLDYKFNKHFKAGLDYRFSLRDNNYKNRVAVSGSYKKGFGDLDMSLRSKMQYSFTPDRSEGTAWRNKLSAKYKINKHFSPFLSGEIFYSFSNKINQFDNYRFETGLNYGLNKHNDFYFSYLYDKEFNLNNPQTLNVLSINYVYSF